MKMSAKVYLALAIAAYAAIVSTLAAPQASSDSVRFSRLLSQQPDLLRFTSISNLGPASAVLEPQFQNVYNTEQQGELEEDDQEEVAPVVVAPSPAPSPAPRPSFLKKKPGLKSSFLRRTENLGDDSLLITRAEPGQEYVYIHQQIKQGDDASSNIPIASLTNLNQKPSGRKPLALLRQSAGNKLNISPVFPDSQTRSRLNGNNQVSILSDTLSIDPQQDSHDDDKSSDATTASPLLSSADEEAEAVTTESVQEDEVPVTTYPPTQYHHRQEKKGRMIVNVVTSAPRFEVENATTPAPAVTTTVIPKVTPQERPSSSSAASSSSSSSSAATSEDEENLLVDAFHRNGQFPDFEDSPAHLHVAESAQPARVNVRPASSGKDYEYEYIYYYYDDEDDDNSTKKATTAEGKPAGPKKQVVVEEAPIDTNESFDAEKVSVSNLPTNSLESAPASRGQKAIASRQEPVVAVPVQSQESQEEVAQITTVQPELLKTYRPNSVNRPVVLKQSKLSPSPADELPTTPIVERRFPTTTTTTTTAAPSTEAPRSRLSFKSRTKAPAVNNFVRPTEETSEVPLAPVEAPARRPSLKDSARRRNPSRRLQAAAQPQEVAAPEQVAPVQAEEPATRLPSRTRFPPRQQTTQAVVAETAITEPAPVQAVVSQEVASSPIQSIEIQPAASVESDRKAKDNFARQKSINDLYALTRLHQLAINTRVPNRKTDGVAKGSPPKVAGGFVNSAEQTTRYSADDSVASNEATTLSSAFPSAVSAESIPFTEHVQQTVAPTTTTTTTTTEAAPERGPGGRQQKNRFRPRGNRLNAAEGTSSTTTETASRAPANPNRFGSRRRFSTSTAAPLDAAPSAASDVEQRPATVRQPTRNRFAGRTRPTTSTTETTAAAGEHTEDGQERIQPQRRRPSNFQGRRRNQQSSTPQSEDAESSPATTAAAAAPARPRSNSESERRRFNFGNSARNRPAGPGAAAERPRPLVRGGRTSTTEAPEVPLAPENPEPTVSEHVSVSEAEGQAEKPEASSDDHAVVSVSSTTSSSVSSSDGVVGKKGSAAVLGRLRSRAKPIATTTTAAPEAIAAAVAAERKPSRLSGILNRRKLQSQPAAAPAKEEVHEVHEESLSPEHEELQRKGVVVKISSTVTESEEIGDHLEQESDHASSTTQTSILNRLKSQRKPGQIYRKSSHSSSSE